ncbi:uncharacterized protein FOMMEDRAFT_160780 [Fomitiporia mediterranea MF3/22]|uniref:uncharacterized protein n=1 Tax=Fomitiporia mediterranea (strain MF3/22) TaxID=694068 RepID=UPI0004408232|nr:uncharacterized protein FOMMEDRAFT_160780 [Fomitiporia mediterranea MF3/22]EJC99204.1 hypothetical protein FOMMEDRAFT_160780 [Fomitiporia mediterranea MF3/22]
MLNLQNPRLFHTHSHSGTDRTSRSTFGAFAGPAVVGRDEQESGSAWLDESAEYSTWNYYAWSFDSETRVRSEDSTGERIQPDIELHPTQHRPEGIPKLK